MQTTNIHNSSWWAKTRDKAWHSNRALPAVEAVVFWPNQNKMFCLWRWRSLLLGLSLTADCLFNNPERHLLSSSQFTPTHTPWRPRIIPCANYVQKLPSSQLRRDRSVVEICKDRYKKDWYKNSTIKQPTWRNSMVPTKTCLSSWHSCGINLEKTTNTVSWLWPILWEGWPMAKSRETTALYT